MTLYARRSSVRTEKGENFVAFKGVKFWNDLDISIRETNQNINLSRSLRSWCLSPINNSNNIIPASDDLHLMVWLEIIQYFFISF